MSLSSLLGKLHIADKFANGELDTILAEIGDDIQLLRDCAVREAVTYVVCDLVDKVVQKFNLQPMIEAFRCTTSLKNGLLINHGRPTNDFPKLDRMRNLISSY
jgi:hypothetical protein